MLTFPSCSRCAFLAAELYALKVILTERVESAAQTVYVSSPATALPASGT
jgi:hypothetical protein